MSTRTKRKPSLRSYAIAAGGTVDVSLPRTIVDFRVRVVDATTFAPIAWTLAYGSDPATLFHFTAGEQYQEEGIGGKAGPTRLTLGAAVAARVELIVWAC